MIWLILVIVLIVAAGLYGCRAAWLAMGDLREQSDDLQRLWEELKTRRAELEQKRNEEERQKRRQKASADAEAEGEEVQAVAAEEEVKFVAEPSHEVDELDFLSVARAFNHAYIRKLALLRPFRALVQYKNAKVKELEKVEASLRKWQEGNPMHEIDRKRREKLMEELEAVKDLGKLEYSLPSHGDLREISLQSELSRSAPSSLHAIVNTLLICGICGTLVGVHLGMRYNDFRDMSNMGVALLPSLCAMFFTFVLLICRAWYVRQVDRFLLALDGWTAEFRKVEMPYQGNKAAEQIEKTTHVLSALLEGRKNVESDQGGLDELGEQLVDRATELQKKVQAVSLIAPTTTLSGDITRLLDDATQKLQQQDQNPLSTPDSDQNYE